MSRPAKQQEPIQPLRIVVCGMPRSMTTWVFNVLRQLVAEVESRNLWVAPGSPEEALFASADGIALAKCHHFSHELAAAADIVIYSYRDMRAAAVSYHRKFGSPCTREQLDNWVAAERAWLPHADMVLRYEEIERDPLPVVGALRRLLATKLDAPQLSRADDDEILARVDRTFEEIQESPRVAYDTSTMILPQHRTFQPTAAELPPAEKAIYDRVGEEFRDWLATHGYVESVSHGQEVEYRIARSLLGLFTAPTVVDVGVERGSFTELALDAGAGHVVGFEPLPRHADFLAARFASRPNVQVHRVAVSDRSGTATFHIATDLAGNELDYHHTLGDLGDSASVIRTRQSIEVKTASLADLVRDGLVPSRLDFLKVDTDGHDLAVFAGLGDVRPTIVMAEYWDTLPESSGNNLYRLQDLADWARAHGYGRMIVVRRHGRIEMVQLDAPWTIAGDWGNVFFLRQDFEEARAAAAIERHSRESYAGLTSYVGALMRDLEAKEAMIQGESSQLRAKEAVIRDLSSSVADMLSQLRGKDAVIADISSQMPAKDAVIAEVNAKLQAKQAEVAVLTDAGRQAASQLEGKQAVIEELSRAVEAYRATFSLLRLFIVPFNFLVLGARSVARRSLKVLRPKLGVLNQHAPIPLRFPPDYATARPPAAPPRISIVTPSYRQATFIERTVRSVLDQGYPNLQFHVQDGNSDDGTSEVLQRYESRLSWESRPDSGQSEAINRGFARSDGEIMAWLNSDDILLPGALAYVADYFARHADVDVVYGHRVLIDESDREIGRWILPAHSDEALSWADFVPQETLFWRRRIWDSAGSRVDESFRFAMDWDMLMRFRGAGARFARLPRLIGAFRIHEKQKTSAAITEVGFDEMNRLRERALGRVPTGNEVRRALAGYMVRHVAADLAWRVRGCLSGFKGGTR